MVTKKASKKTKTPKVEEKLTPEVVEEPTPEVKADPEPKEEKKSDVIGSLKGGKDVHMKGQFLKFNNIAAPIHKDQLPEDIQRWLTNKGYGTDVYKESKEWLERHHVDPVMVEKLKKFINDRLI